MVTIPHPKFVFGELTEKLKATDKEIAVPRKLLEALLDLYISYWDFDEEWYLEMNPDIKVAVDEGAFLSGRDHFKKIGYFEGRIGYKPYVDVDWYLSTYPDIAEAMLQGTVKDAEEHFRKFGYAEGRLPEDPRINVNWYAKRYMPSIDPRSADERDALEHFLRRGYRQLAFPTPHK